MREDKDRAIVRDFGTDVSTRYPTDFTRSTGVEGRSYEDLQVPDKLRLREILRRWDDLERVLPFLEKFLSAITYTFEQADTEEAVPHQLGTIPDDVILGVSTPGPGASKVSFYPLIKRGRTPWTRQKIFLQCDTAGATVTVYPVVLRSI